MDELVLEARRAEQEKRERSARICAAIERQIKQAEKAHVVVIHRQRPPKKSKREIDLSTLAEMEDEETILFENALSKNREEGRR